MAALPVDPPVHTGVEVFKIPADDRRGLAGEQGLRVRQGRVVRAGEVIGFYRGRCFTPDVRTQRRPPGFWFRFRAMVGAALRRCPPRPAARGWLCRPALPVCLGACVPASSPAQLPCSAIPSAAVSGAQECACGVPSQAVRCLQGPSLKSQDVAHCHLRCACPSFAHCRPGRLHALHVELKCAVCWHSGVSQVQAAAAA